MKFFDLIRTAARGLRTNLTRSLLTILGIVIGVSAIVLVLSFGKGAQNLILNEVQGVGGDAIIVRPGREPSGPSDVADTILSDSLTQRDVDALQKTANVPNVKSVHPAVLVPGSVAYRDETFRPTILGWDAEAISGIFHIYPSEGDFFTDSDVKSRAAVAVIGSRVKDELFRTTPAVGQIIKVKNKNMRVIGVLPKRGQVSFFNLDTTVLIPSSTAQKDILGINYYHEILVRITDPSLAETAADDIRATLREQHSISDPKKDDFYVTTQQDIVQRLSTITQVLTIFLSAIAAISLVVGGVGIMNIMLVSVTERTKEIGLRKTLGATNKDILGQFLLEALFLTISGGALGILIATGISLAAAAIIRTQFNLPWEFIFPLSALTIGLGMAGSVGIIFGLYPAILASRKSPIEALRYE